MTILVITTGGTIGALAYDDPKNPPPNISIPPDGHDYVLDALKGVFSKIDTRCISLPSIDSKSIDNRYRENILSLIGEAPEKSILITHGTDAILETAHFLDEAVKTRTHLSEKVIVLTGAMIPLANGQKSDGYLNLAFALDQLAHSNFKAMRVTIVLCDFDMHGHWNSRAYVFKPQSYYKYFDKDGRYNRLKEIGVS